MRGGESYVLIYSGVITAVAIGMYAHIRHVEGWVDGMRIALDAQLKAEKNPEEGMTEDESAT